jgi:hypothetical protein
LLFFLIFALNRNHSLIHNKLLKFTDGLLYKHNINNQEQSRHTLAA